jgi:hypothetical protein
MTCIWLCFVVVVVVVIVVVIVIAIVIVIVVVLSSSVIVIIIITISFMQGIYTYIPETNHVPKGYNVAAVLSLLFMAPISLFPALALMYFCLSTF